MKLELENFIESEFLLQYKIIVDNKKEISNNILENKQVISISKEYYNRPLKLIIENYFFSNNNLKSWLYMAINVVANFWGAGSSLGKPITYIYDFILLGDAKITFNKESERFFKALKCINPLTQDKGVYKKQYNKWILVILFPIQIAILVFVIIIASLLFKNYLIIPIILYVSIQICICFYIKSFKKKYKNLT